MGALSPDADLATGVSHTPEPVFIALSQPARLALYRRLLAAGASGLSKRQLMTDLHFTGGALTCHARALQDAGLLEVMPESRRIGSKADHRSGGYRCRARLAPLQSLVRSLSNEATLALAPNSAPRPREVLALRSPDLSLNRHASAPASHAT
jgi:hypothetical protein